MDNTEVDIQTMGLVAIMQIANNVVAPEIRKGIMKAAANANLSQAFTIKYGNKSPNVVKQSIPYISANLMRQNACIKSHQIFKMSDDTTALYIVVSWAPDDVAKAQRTPRIGFLDNFKGLFKFGKPAQPK